MRLEEVGMRLEAHLVGTVLLDGLRLVEALQEHAPLSQSPSVEPPGSHHGARG